MLRRPRRLGLLTVAVGLGVALLLSSCGSITTPGPEANSSKGPITIWYSNNPEEVAWGKQMVKEWNSTHSEEQVTGQEIPAGKTSEEVIYAAVTAGTAPCLILNTAPSAVPQFEKAAGLVDLGVFEGSTEYIEKRTGKKTAEQFQSPDVKYYQFPWKGNPVMILYNKEIFKKAGIDTENPPLNTYAEFLATAEKVVSSGAAKAAIYPAPSSEFFQPWFDFYPLFVAETRKQLVEDDKATYANDQGEAVSQFWKTIYEKRLAPREKYNGDAFGDGITAMQIVGPWAVAVYGDTVDWGAVPVPTGKGKPADEIYTFGDAKNIGMYTACPNRLTAWEYIKFVSSVENDGKWLDTTGQMPLRENLPEVYPEYFAKNPVYTQFADQTARIIEVPNVPNSIEVWQTFRNMWTQAVVFGEGDLRAQLDESAEKIDKLVERG